MDSGKTRVATILTGIFLGISLSVVLSLVGILLATRQNGRFSITGWLITLVASIIVSLALGFIIPMDRAAKGTSKACKLKPGGIPARLVETLVMDIIYTPVVNFLMVFISRQKAISNGAPPQTLHLGKMFLLSFPGVFVTGYIFIFVFLPLFEKLAKMIAMKTGNKNSKI